MAPARICVSVGAVLLWSTVIVAPAFAQAPPVPPPAATPTPPSPDVQGVKDELDRLRREFEAVRRAYDDRLLALELRLTQIGGGPLTVTPAATTIATPTPAAVIPAEAGTPVPAVTVAAQAPPAGASKVFNPDISVNGNFVAAAGRNPFATLPAMALSEVEAAFQAIVDPYAKADFFLSVGQDGLEVEEGFITFTSLPAKFQVKVGKLRANFGKMNTQHTHALPSVDRPLVTENLVGGDEGMSDAGFSVSRIFNNPYVFLELTGEVFTGNSAVFQSDHRAQLSYVARARAYRDLTESSNIDIGTSVAFGTATVDLPMPPIYVPGSATLQATGLDKRLIGLDATFRYRPLRRAIYQRLNIRSEFVWSQQQMFDAPAQDAFGLYVSGEYQFARRWYIGGRGDHSGRVTDGAAIDNGGSVFLTFWPTEFSQVRGQFRQIRFAGGERANEFLVQFNFSIGAHGAHVF